jgi:hypothetical protein
VITVQTNAKKLGFSNIVLPIDDCFESRQKVDFTNAFAKNYSAKIHILALFEKSADADLKKFRVKINSVEKIIKKAGLTICLCVDFYMSKVQQKLDWKCVNWRKWNKALVLSLHGRM